MSAIEYIYWPFLGRGAAIRFLLEDSKHPYTLHVQRKREVGVIDPGVYAVPAVRINGVWYSQSFAALYAVAEELGYLPPNEYRILSMQACLNLQDLLNELLKVKSDEQKEQFENGRLKEWLLVLEANVTICKAGPFCYGETISYIDFEILKVVLALRGLFSTTTLQESAPTVLRISENVSLRPNVHAFFERDFDGQPLLMGTK